MAHQPLHGRPATSTSTAFRLHRPCLMLVVVITLLCPLDNVLAQREGNTQTAKAQSPTEVLQGLLVRYGDNFTITVPQLRALLSHLSRDQGDEANDTAVAVTERPPVATPKTISSKVSTIGLGSGPRLVQDTGEGLHCSTIMDQHGLWKLASLCGSRWKLASSCGS